MRKFVQEVQIIYIMGEKMEGFLVPIIHIMRKRVLHTMIDIYSGYVYKKNIE